MVRLLNTYQTFWQLFHCPEEYSGHDKYKQLVIPKVKRQTFAARSFSIKALSLWNGLPDSLHRANDEETFKAELKNTYLNNIICRSM